MATNVSGDNIRDLLIGIANTLKTKINAIDLTQVQKDAIAIIDKIVKTGDGTKYLANDGNYKTLPLDQISNLQTQLSTINSTLGVALLPDQWAASSIVMPIGLHKAGSVLYNGKVYIIGGYNGVSLKSVQIYDIASNTWSTGADMPSAKCVFSCELYNGKIYCIGGWTSAPVNSNYIYDIASNTWSTGANLPISLSDSMSKLYNNRIYIIGGYNGSAVQSSVLIYDISSNTFSSAASMPTAIYSGKVANYNDKLYVIGGTVTGGAVTSIVQVYNITSNSWTTGTSMITPRRGFSCIQYAGKIYCIGGETNNTSQLSITEIYDILGNTWASGTSMSIALSYPSSIVYNGSIYIFGGISANGTSYLNSVRLYVFSHYTYSITLPATLTNTLSILTTTGDGTKLLTDNGTYQVYAPSGYREMTTDELSLLISDIQTTLQ